MTVAANSTRISQVGTVFILVGDQDRALKFYLDKLGIEKRADFPYGKGSRWIEVVPPGAITTISLVPRAMPDGLFARCEDARPNRAFLTRLEIWEMRDSW